MNADDKLKLKKYKAKIIFDIKPYIFFIVLSIVCFVVSIVFISQLYFPIELEEASSYHKSITGIEVSYGNKGNLRKIDIICTDGTKLYVDSAVATEQLKEELEKLIGESASFFINDKTDCVIQINHNSYAVIDAKTSQNRLFVDSVIFVLLGVFLFVFSVVLSVFSFKKCIQLKSEKREYLKSTDSR